MNSLSSKLTTLAVGTLSLTFVGSEALAQQQNPPQQPQQGQAQPAQPGAGNKMQQKAGAQQQGQQRQGMAQQQVRQAQRPLTESAEQARQRTNKPREVSGTILGLKSIGIRGSDVQNRVALLRTNKGNQRLVVDLGPQQELKGLNIAEGQRVAVQGRVVRVGDRQLLVAEKVQQKDQTRQLQRTAQIQAAQGQQASPPGQQATPPGQQATPPGQQATPPRQQPANPGQQGNPEQR